MLVDQIIGLQQDAMVDAINGIISVMMADQPADALDICLFQADFFQQFAGRFNTLLLLQRAAAAAVLFLGGLDADIVDQRRTLQNKLGMGIKTLTLTL